MAGEEGATELPIFELPAVLLPGELMPLHIFEERYKRMIGHCLDAEQPFGVVFRDDELGARRIGCTARVTEVLERFDDGRLNVVVTGELPFRVLERFETDEYPAGEVAPVRSVDSGEEVDDEVGESARTAFADLVKRVSGSTPDTDELAECDSYDLASRVELPADTKQRLLELRSEDERMQTLGDALRELIRTLRRSREVAERARMNGKVVFS